ncbi:MAG: hypothetical protein CMH22_05540 [Methylophaga sp.]|mgnify:CR=1 FL=1|nr:hypothetical protein [Methylophaga sp.]|tara:strand:- start:116854 stop:117036 length:183 start_codon:yes stop_codon:yes gene_type:complete
MEWINVKKPFSEYGFLYKTVNGKIGVSMNRKLDDWFINKYAVQYYIPILNILSLPHSDKL